MFKVNINTRMDKNNIMANLFQNLKYGIVFKKVNHYALDVMIENLRIFAKKAVDFGYYFHASE
ncbi:hypothetical protein B1J93_09130 [Leptospira kirschneri serovar Pomona]|uniref:Uncharacterized protein n=1 Tax=Leptospira kirschneri serovar Pomona TaxID=561005 RepID=A0A1T1DPQ2_9LEPT|nr:hypothetical protein B1J93_09130 [Leptospira kirschneri serovar Pomona]